MSPPPTLKDRIIPHADRHPTYPVLLIDLLPNRNEHQRAKAHLEATGRYKITYRKGRVYVDRTQPTSPTP